MKNERVFFLYLLIYKQLLAPKRTTKIQINSEVSKSFSSLRIINSIKIQGYRAKKSTSFEVDFLLIKFQKLFHNNFIRLHSRYGFYLDDVNSRYKRRRINSRCTSEITRLHYLPLSRIDNIVCMFFAISRL